MRLEKLAFIGMIYVHSCNQSYANLTNINIVFSEKEISSAKCCGFVDPNNFGVNLPFVLESKKNNSCLNKKISIDQLGNIRNCPSLSTSFGNITENKLEDIVKIKKFKEYWNIPKDSITVCKDCEFRYICSDCRAYVEDPKDKYSKPLKCGYDPYSTKWEEWSTNSVKKSAINFYEIDV